MTEVRNFIDQQPETVMPDFTDIAEYGLYVPELERDACGVGMVANITGTRSHEIIDQALGGPRRSAGYEPGLN